MRHFVLLALLVPALALGGTGVLTPAPAGAQLPTDDPARGVVYSGLRPADPNGPCHGNFEVPSSGEHAGAPVSCTHGPDPAPPGIDIRRRRGPSEIRQEAAAQAAAAPATAYATQGVQCYDNGTSGDRVQLLYTHASDVSDEYSSLSGQFPQWAAAVDGALNASAAETGGVRHIRFVTDAGCNLVIPDVTIPSTADDSLTNMESALRALGYNRSDRKYLIWSDATVYCGIADLYLDDSPGPANNNNGDPSVAGMFARVDNGCWGQTNAVELHELTHTLGSVQTTAPHATANFHCTDDADRMCYVDGPGVVVNQICPPVHESRLDCRHDDYFDTSPVPGSYLATHWNTANNSFLSSTGPTWLGPPGVQADFDGDRKTDIGVFRPSVGGWYLNGGGAPTFFGLNGDVPVPGDYDADGKTDMAVFRPAVGAWYINGGGAPTFFGNSGDIPVPGDYNGDWKTDMAVFRPSSGAWYINGGGPPTYFGVNGDIPVPGDYDGNGTTDIAVFRPSTGAWYINGAATTFFGLPGDIPVPGDYNGDGKTDIAVYRPSSGAWYVNGGATTFFGLNGDIPVQSDYAGTASATITVYRPSSGAWYVNGGATTFFGLNGDVPLPVSPAARLQFFP